MSESERRYRRRVLRPLFAFAALVAVAVIVVPIGSAKPPPPPIPTYQVCLTDGVACTPTAAGGDYSVVSGANPAFQVTITDDSTSGTNLAWANIAVPTGIGVSIDTTHSPQSASYTTYASTSTSSTLQLRNLGLTPGTSKTVTFFVKSTSASCTDGNWTTQARSSSNGSGVVFTNPPSKSGGLTSLVAVNCALSFETNPAPALKNTKITGSAYNTSGTPVTVATPNLPVSLSGGSVSLGIKSGSFDNAGDSFSGTGAPGTIVPFAGGSAAFGSLQASGTGGPFTLTASAAGFADAVSSPAFAITKTGESCASTCAPIGTADDSGNPLIQITTSAGFGFVGSSPSAVPLDPNNPLGPGPVGCQSWKPLTGGVSGFAEFDGRTDPLHASMTVTYYVSMNAIKARYGKNVGQQFIPICVGVQYVDPLTGLAQDCTVTHNPNPWVGDALDPTTGAFTGGTSRSVCGPDGYYWGIISSFQDKLDQSTNPVVTSWGSGSVGGGNFRAFVMSVPAGLDYRGHG
jgi:hypothetical protein